MWKHAPPKVQTRDDLRRHIRPEDNKGFGFEDYERWFTKIDEFGKLPTLQEIKRKTGRDTRTIKNYRNAYFNEKGDQ